MHSRRHDLPAALALLKEMQSLHGLAPNIRTYNTALTACTHGMPSGYNLGPDAVAAAESLMGQLHDAGLQADVYTHTIMMTVYARAGMLKAVEEQRSEMEAAGFPPTVRTFNALLDACKRTGRPEAAAHILHEVMPAARVAPDVISWNTLLGAYGRNGHIDGAYATWQDMMRAGVVPTAATEAELSEAFSSSPSFAADVVGEARRFRSLLSASSSPPPLGVGQVAPPSFILLGAFQLEGYLRWLRHGTTSAFSAPPSQAGRTTQGQAAHAGGAAGGRVTLDVHRLNRSQARSAILATIHDYLTALPSAQVDALQHAIVAGELWGHPSSRGHDDSDAPPPAQFANSLREERGGTSRDAASAPFTATPPPVQQHRGPDAGGVADPAQQPHAPQQHDPPSPAGGRRRESEGAGEWGEGPNCGGLTIIVGRGLSTPQRGANIDRNALKLAVTSLLDTLQLKGQAVARNPGRIYIPRRELLILAASSQHRGEQHAMMSRMAFRTVALLSFAACTVQFSADPLFGRVLRILLLDVI